MSVPEHSLADFSKEIFGRRNRLPVWGKVLEYAIEPPEPFSAKDIEEGFGEDETVERGGLYIEFRTLAQLGMMEEYSDHGEYPSRYYVRVESAGWDMVAAAIRFAQEVDEQY